MKVMIRLSGSGSKLTCNHWSKLCTVATIKMTLQGLIEKMTFDINPGHDAEMLGKILGNKNVKKHILQRLAVVCVILFLWYWLNGGLFTFCYGGWGISTVSEYSRK